MKLESSECVWVQGQTPTRPWHCHRPSGTSLCGQQRQTNAQGLRSPQGRACKTCLKQLATIRFREADQMRIAFLRWHRQLPDDVIERVGPFRDRVAAAIMTWEMTGLDSDLAEIEIAGRSLRDQAEQHDHPYRREGR